MNRDTTTINACVAAVTLVGLRLILVPQYLAWGAGAVMILAAQAATGLRLLLIRGKRIRVRDRRPLLIAFGGITLGASAALVVSHFSSTWPFYSALAGGAVLTLPVAATMSPALDIPGTAPRLANAPILRVLFGRSGPGRTGTGSTRSEDPASRTEPWASQRLLRRSAHDETFRFVKSQSSALGV